LAVILPASYCAPVAWGKLGKKKLLDFRGALRAIIDRHVAAGLCIDWSALPFQPVSAGSG